MNKIFQIWLEIPSVLISFIALIAFGIAFQYSVAVSWYPWAISHLIKFLIFFPLIFIIGIIDIKLIHRYSYAIFLISIASLIFVQLFGHTGMGAQRWVDLYLFKLQPSEFTKVSTVLFLSRFYSGQADQDVAKISTHIKAFIISTIPIGLVAIQPDLGTAMLITGLLMFAVFLCGLKTRYIVFTVVCLLVSLPIVWTKLHDYQKHRITSFLDPESDPRGNGYHIIQSKIAIGSGGINGKGFLNGTQSKLNFLPEKHTDFIFTSICEESGLIGAIVVISLFATIIFSILSLAYSCIGRFPILLCFNVCFLIFEHVIVNMCMVSGLIPVVGVPLPFVSYGGSSLLSFTIMLGLIANVSINRTSRIGY